MPELIYILAWFILPLIPAFILFKFLPSVGNVEGPLKGMQLKFGGAFAGYLVLFFLSYNVMASWMKKADSTDEVWTIKGDIGSTDNRFNLQEDKPTFTIDPLGQRFHMKCFDLKVVATADAKGYLSFPMLTLAAYNYKQYSLPILDFDKTRKNIDTTNYAIIDYRSRIIRVKNKIVLEPENNLNGMTASLNHAEMIAVDTSLVQH